MSKSMIDGSGPTFFERFAQGDASEDDIDDFIDYWHDEAPRGAQGLHEFLGLTWSEYGLWLTEPDALRRILIARRTGQPLERSQNPRLSRSA